MIEMLKNTLDAQQFLPGLLGIWVNPFYLARKGLYREMTRCASALKGRLLDVGCGQKPYTRLFDVDEYIGLEIDTPENRLRKHADQYYDGTRFPFPDASFDGVLCNQVLEHVFEPTIFISEIRRVLRPGGRLLLTVPFVWDEHEQPWDYARYTSFGLRHLLEGSGFIIREHRKVNADARIIFQLAIAYLYKVLWTQYPWLNLIICAFLIAPITLSGLLFSRLLPVNPDLYLDQVVLAERSEDV